jgi:phage shock protein A
LSIYKEKLVGRFLLKDSRYEQSAKLEKHVNDNVKTCVDRMIEQLTEMEAKQKSTKE